MFSCHGRGRGFESRRPRCNHAKQGAKTEIQNRRTEWPPPRAVVTIEHLVGGQTVHYAAMKTKREAALAVRCPTCGAEPGEKCELSTGLPRTEPHRDRHLAATE